jgi:hypothetical protein
MSKLIASVIPMSLLVCSSLLVAGESPSGASNLEPCMNGEVSASGTFPTNAAERQFDANAEGEPCMNADVPPDGVLTKDLVEEGNEKGRTAGTP